MTNTTWMNNVSDPGAVIEGVIHSTNGGLVIAILVSLWFVAAATLRAKGKEMDEILIYTGALEFMLCAYAIATSWIQFYFIMAPVALIMAGIMVRLFGQN